MWIELMINALHSYDKSNDFRKYIRELTLMVQNSLKDFHPMDTLSLILYHVIG